MASKAANARRKGIAYEGLCRRWWTELWGFTFFDPSGGSGHEGSDIGMVELPYIRGEAKNQKKMTLSVWLNQAVAQARAEGAEIAFVQHKRHGTGNEVLLDGGLGSHYISMRAVDFARILATLRDHDIRNLSEVPTSVEESKPDGKQNSRTASR